MDETTTRCPWKPGEIAPKSVVFLRFHGSVGEASPASVAWHGTRGPATFLVPRLPIQICKALREHGGYTVCFAPEN